MCDLSPIFLDFDDIKKNMLETFRDLLYQGITTNLDSLLSTLNEKVNTISTDLTTSPMTWQGGNIWEIILKIANNAILPAAGIVFTFIIIWDLIHSITAPNNLGDVDFISVMIKWLMKVMIASFFITHSLQICSCFIGMGTDMIAKSVKELEGYLTIADGQEENAIKFLKDNYGESEEDEDKEDDNKEEDKDEEDEKKLELGDIVTLALIWANTGILYFVIQIISILISIIMYSRMIEIYMHCAVAPLPMATLANPTLNSMGINFMKSVFGLAMQGVMMMICVAIYGVLVAKIFSPETLTLVEGKTAAQVFNSAVWETIMISVLLIKCLFSCEKVTKTVFAIQ